MKTVRLVKFEKWAGNPCGKYAILWNTKLENMQAAFITHDGVGDDSQIACPAEWKEINLSDLPDSLDFDAVVHVLESATETIMLEGDHAVDFADDEEWVCDHFNCPLDGKKIGNRCEAEEVAEHFKEHGKKPIVLLSFNFFQKRVQYIYAVVPKEWDYREADMRLSGYEDNDWDGSLAWLSEYGYLA